MTPTERAVQWLETPEDVARVALQSKSPHMEVMTPDHDLWRPFIDALETALNFRETENGDETWDCDHTHRHAARILANMPKIDVRASLNHFWLVDAHGCDCEVYLNGSP